MTIASGPWSHLSGGQGSRRFTAAVVVFLKAATGRREHEREGSGEAPARAAAPDPASTQLSGHCQCPHLDSGQTGSV
ncbi:hypothetical protein [Streptomyces sp. NPDC002209]|uniref:hypothetical protein n=1 Tax=Streptomyces sp. NPDC002209 TaxID=3364638 RepID=UPI003697A9DD